MNRQTATAKLLPTYTFPTPKIWILSRRCSVYMIQQERVYSVLFIFILLDFQQIFLEQLYRPCNIRQGMNFCRSFFSPLAESCKFFPLHLPVVLKIIRKYRLFIRKRYRTILFYLLCIADYIFQSREFFSNHRILTF